MRQDIIASALPPPAPPQRAAILDSRYLPPIFITCILLAGNLTFGMLES